MQKERVIRRIKDGVSQFAVILLEDGGLPPRVMEVHFEDGRSLLPEGKSYVWEEEDLPIVVQEQYLGVEDPRLPEDVKGLPVGRREDFVETFNRNIFWYWKDEDEEYNENEPLHVNAVRYALKAAYKAIGVGEDVDVGEAVPGISEKFEKFRVEYVGPLSPENIQEAEGGGYKIDGIQVIEGGWSLNGHYFTSEALQDIANLLKNRVVSYLNHGDSHRDPVRDWSMVYEDGWIEGNTVQSKAHLFEFPDGKALRERIEYVRQNKALHLFGVSIDGLAKISMGTKEGREGQIVERVVALPSVDTVMLPAAGGRFGKTKESVEEENPTGKTNTQEDMEDMDIAKLKEEHPDVAEALREEGRVEVRENELKPAQETVGTLETQVAEKDQTIAQMETRISEFEGVEKSRLFQEKTETFIRENLKEIPVLITEAFIQEMVGLGEENWGTIERLVSERKTLRVSGPEGMGDPTPPDKKEVTEEERLAIAKAAVQSVS